MKPQPPVTKMRIPARTSSAGKEARADFFSAQDSLALRLFRALESDWMFWTILLLATTLRFFLLGIKPPHFDEGINGWFVDQMLKNGFYKYDPTNYHGPLHFYVLFLSQNLLGRNLWALRLPVVLVSIACVWLAMRFDRVLPRSVARLAALAMAVSPAFIFYGRYSIHEVWLLLFSMMFMLGLLGLWLHGTVDYLWYTGIGIAGMILTKETYIIHLGCALIALPLLFISMRIWPVENPEPIKQKWTSIDLAMVCLVGVGAIIFFYSGTFFHWSGIKGLYQSFHAWFKTGHNGNGHEKPFYYWLILIARYEWPVCVGLVLCGFCQLFRNISLRYLGITGFGIFLAYSIVHYKTPWCIISMIWPLIFIFGSFILIVPKRWLTTSLAIAALTLTTSLGWAISLNYFRCSTFADFGWNPEKTLATNVADFFWSEPYVYVQTYNDIYKLTTPLLELAHADPKYYHITGHIIRASPYPLPWILDDFPRIGYYEHASYPPAMDADFLLVQEDKVAEVESKLHDSYFTEPLTIRPYQDPSKLYFRANLFKNFFPGQAPDFVGAH
jgi:uncharacterized protein (TIGR03663 family)